MQGEGDVEEGWVLGMIEGCSTLPARVSTGFWHRTRTPLPRAARPSGRGRPWYTTEGPSWRYSKVNFDRFFRKHGRFSPNVDKKRANGSKNEPLIPPHRAFCGVCSIHTSSPRRMLHTQLLPVLKPVASLQSRRGETLT